MEVPRSTAALRNAERALLLDAAAMLPRRYVHYGAAGLSSAAAEQLANVLKAFARNQPGTDGVERKEAIALAHRLIDDDHPEHSRMWPAVRAG